jgi:membrane protease YdiL (CAAX protease family)
MPPAVGGDPEPRPRAPRPSALDATILPLWILVGQLLAGIALLPGLLFIDDLADSAQLFIAGSAILGWLAVVVGTALWLRLRRAWQPTWLTGHRPRSGWLAGLIGAGGAVGGFLVVQLVVGLLIWVTGQEPPQQEIFDLMGDPTVALVLSLIAVFVAPVVEEIIFRGVLQDVLARRLSWGLAAILQSAIFSAIHIETLTSPPMFLALGLLGYLFTWLRRWTGSLVAPIIAHLVFNAISMLLATFGPDGPTTGLIN